MASQLTSANSLLASQLSMKLCSRELLSLELEANGTSVLFMISMNKQLLQIFHFNISDNTSRPAILVLRGENWDSEGDAVRLRS